MWYGCLFLVICVLVEAARRERESLVDETTEEQERAVQTVKNIIAGVE